MKQVVEQAPKSQQKIANNSEFYQLPKKYLRKQLTNDEIEAINVNFCCFYFFNYKIIIFSF